VARREADVGPDDVGSRRPPSGERPWAVMAALDADPAPAPTTAPPASAAAPPDLALARTAVEVLVRVGVLAVLVAWCFAIARPFVVAVLWGVILAVATHPGYARLRDGLGGRPRLAATLLTLLALLLLIGPLGVLTAALVGNVGDLAARLTAGELAVPAPPAGLAEWPLVGHRLERLWRLASVNLLSALSEVQPQLRALGRWLLSLVAGAGLGLLNFVAAVVIAGLLLARSADGRRLANAAATRLAGERGPELAGLAEHTVRGVARGVLGTALIQSALAGAGFVAAGVPWAALLTLACFLLGVVQLGPAIVLLGAVAYVLSTAGALVGGLFLAWCVFVGAIDNVLRPLLIGRGSEVPLAVILAGVLGGLLAHGLIGLFVGPIVLALGHELLRAWLAGPGGVAAPPEG
jgi:predicted PurR-regulated permease PerM